MLYGAAASVGGAAISSWGKHKLPTGYKPNVGYLRDYENKQHGDINRLYGRQPYEGSDLGFSGRVMGAQMGVGTGESQAEYKTDVGNIERTAAQGGGMRVGSGSYVRAKQRALHGHLARTADVRRRNIILDAMQRRADFQNRFRMTSGAYEQGTGLMNQWARAKAAKGNWATELGGALKGMGAASSVTG